MHKFVEGRTSTRTCNIVQPRRLLFIELSKDDPTNRSFQSLATSVPILPLLLQAI